jgi:predicted metal-dependent peptidase
MTVTDKIQKAKIQLILSQPFFATLLMSISIAEDTTIKKAATDGEAIKYNPEYINGLQVDEVKGLLCSGIMKIANLHHLRRNGRDNDTWQKASELSVNTMIEDSGLTLPKDSLKDKQYKDLAAEQIFSMLPVPMPKDKPQGGQRDPNGAAAGPNSPQPGNDNNGPMEVQDGPQKTQVERDQQAAKIKQKVAQAAQIAKKAGKMPGDIARMVEELLQPQINWKEVLARFIMDTARNDYSFKKPNARFIHSGFYLPSLYNEEPGNIVFIVDTSASIDKQLFNQFAGELQDVCSTLQSGLVVMYVDTKVQGVQEIEPDEQVKLNAIGGGGTSFAPGFNYIHEHGLTPKAIVYLTDGESDDYPEEEPDAPVLWVKYGNYKRFNPPFGEIIEIK